MKMRKINVCVIGTGFIGKQHIEAIRRIPGTFVAAVVDTNEAAAKSISESMGIPKYYIDYKEMLKDETIDIVHNCTPSAFHYEINKDIIKSRKHVYCEKPLTLTAAESEELVTLAKEYNVSAAANFNYRHNAMVREIHEKVHNGSTGRILSVHGEYLQDWLLYDTDYDWRMDKEMGGESRAIADIGSHCFDTIQYVLDKKITSVYANLITAHPIRKKSQSAGTFTQNNNKEFEEVKIDSEDEAHIIVRFEDGTQGLFHVSQICAGKKNHFALTISGEKLSLEWDQERCDKLWIGNRNTGNMELFAGPQYLTGEAVSYATLPNGHSVGWADAFRNGINSYYKAIDDGSYKNEKQGYATFSEAWYVMKIVEACLESNKINQWVDIK